MKGIPIKLNILFLVAVISLTFLTACSQPESAGTSPLEITDQLGRTVVVEETPQTIVSLAPSNTEILFALGLGDRVVAVTDFCNYPPEVEEEPTVGGFSNPNIEEIVALSPDLVLATSMHEGEIIPQLEEYGVTVFALNPMTIDEVVEAITMVGEVTGTEDEAADLLSDMQKRIKAVTDKMSGLSAGEKPRVLYAVWHDPVMTAGAGTLHDELMTLAGGDNIAHDLAGFDTISLEVVITANPQVMIAGVGMGTGEDMPLQFVSTEPRLSDTDARKNDRVYAINVDLVGRPGPRIVEALEQFAVFLHPEIFG